MGAEAAGLFSNARKSARSSPSGGSAITVLSTEGVGVGVGADRGRADGPVDPVTATTTTTAVTPSVLALAIRRRGNRTCLLRWVERHLPGLYAAYPCRLGATQDAAALRLTRGVR